VAKQEKDVLEVGTLPMASPSGAASQAPRSGIRLVTERWSGLCYAENVVAADDVTVTDPLKAIAVDARAGDAFAVRRLLDAVAPPMLNVVRAVLGSGDRDTEDVLQESLVGVIQGLESFRGDSSFLHFARSIALRRSLDQRRKRARRGPEITLHPDNPHDDTESRPQVLEDDLRSEDLSPAASAIAAQRRTAFRSLLEELRPEQAEAFAQRVLFGYSMQEIALQTGAPLDTVKSRLRLAKAALRSRIQDDPTLLELSETDDDDAS
jgi:RNA polymerase sigma factor (sigma-70 family)